MLVAGRKRWSMKRKSSKQDVYADLRRRIISMDLPPGEDLDEVELVDHYGVSRTPIRETLIRLQGEGLVELRRNRGAYVAPLDFPTLKAYFEAADYLHRAVVRLAALRRSDEDLQAIHEAMLSFEDALKQGDSYLMVTWNDRFHERIGVAASNKYLLGAYRRVLADHERIAALIFNREIATNAEAEISLTLEQHRSLYAALENNQASKAEEIAAAHLNLCRDGLTELLEKSTGALDGIELAAG